jgi:hypothetical protein
VTGWTQPAERWQEAHDPERQLAWLHASGVVVARWPALPTEPSPTECFQVGADYWLWQPGIGGLQALTDPPSFVAYRDHACPPERFEALVRRSWVPSVYQVWGRQVLHASAVAREDGERVVALVGPTGVGKSTLAYGLGQRPGWTQIADDTVAFSRDGDSIRLHPLLNHRRLRAASAAYFGKPMMSGEVVGWPSLPLRLTGLYLLAEDAAQAEPVSITAGSAAESYPVLLGQAFALSVAVPSHNEQLLLDYLALARVPAFRMRYCRTFEAFNAVLDGLAAHARRQPGSG